MDLAYPLTLTSGGSLSFSEDINRDHTTHLLDTYAGERTLFPTFGIPATLFFSSDLPELSAEQIRTAVASFVDSNAQVKILGFIDSVLSVQITLSTGTIVNGEIF